ncbi:hypothetical protein LRS56_27015 [Pseudomonas poae]|nr:hypothetical protein LRS56_27015 [Pseudomonas poae]
MKLSGQFHIPLVLPQVNTDTPQHKIPVPPGVMHSANSTAPVTDYGYPEATAEERFKRAFKAGGLLRSKVGTGQNKVKNKCCDSNKTDGKEKAGSSNTVGKDKLKPETAYKKESQKLPGGPNSPGSAAHKSHTINNLQRSGFFPPVSAEIAKVVRNALVEATVGGLVSLGFSVARHVISDKMEKRITAQAEMPGAEKKNADGTKSTVDPSATQQQKIDARVEGAEIKVELLANTIISVNEGPDAPAVGKSPDAPTTTNERLANLEKTLDAAEGPLEDIAVRYGQLYTRSSAADSSSPSTPEERLDHIEQRYVKMDKMFKRLVLLKEAEAAEEE